MPTKITDRQSYKNNCFYRVTYKDSIADVKGSYVIAKKIVGDGKDRWGRPSHEYVFLDKKNSYVIYILNSKHKPLLRVPYFGNAEDVRDPLYEVQFMCEGNILYAETRTSFLDPFQNIIEEL